MWLTKHANPIFFTYFYFNSLFNIKLNSNRTLFCQILSSCSTTTISFYEGENVLAQYLNVLCNLYRGLPFSFKFYFIYRNRNFIILCTITFLTFYIFKSFYVLISEMFVFSRKIHNYNVNHNNLTFLMNLMHLNYYNRKLSDLEEFLHFYIIIKNYKLNDLKSDVSLKILQKINFKFINLLKSNYGL